MNTLVPDYYLQFHCIAGQCRHTCCVGWEIDVDDRSLARYQAAPAPWKQQLAEQIVREPDGSAHFRLTPEERCPFLNQQNLCRLILGLGEEALCQICSDHPRFRNELSGHTELGLGLCCEEAVRLVLHHPGPVTLVSLSREEPTPDPDPWDQQLLALRSRVFAGLQNRSRPLDQRIGQLKQNFRVRLPDWSPARWARCFLSLEQLDPQWTGRLHRLARTNALPADLPPWMELPLEQLLVYLVYRHLVHAQDAEEVPAYLAFALLGAQLVRMLVLADPDPSPEDLDELARLFSSEIEYSEDNTDQLLDLLWDLN